MARKYEIRTNNSEIYKKFNGFNFVNEVVLMKQDSRGLKRIVNNINRNGKKIEMLDMGGIIILRKIKPIDFKVYLNN